MNEEQTVNSPDIVISNDVIEKIAKTAALEVEGVVAVTTSLGSDLIDKISKKNHNRGVSIINENGNVTITLSVIVYYDYNINEIAEKMQNKVSEALEAMTGYICSAVNINVIGIEVQEKVNKSAGE